MTTFEFFRRLEKITPDVIREIGVRSVHNNESRVVLDSILTNHPNYSSNREIPSAGKTFTGNEIVGTKNFSDWDDSYQFHDNLKFLEEQNIEFTSTGKGYAAIKASFDEDDWIAPHARTLSEEATENIRKSFIEILKEKLT